MMDDNGDDARAVSTAHVLQLEDVPAYRALRSGAVYWDVPIGWTSFHGDKAIETLNGLITNDIATLAEGASLYAAALSPKGKLVTDMDVIRVSDTALLVGVVMSSAADWLALTRKYVNPRLAKVTDETASLRTWMVYGPDAAAVVANAPDSLRVVAARERSGLPGFMIIANRDDTEQVTHVENMLSRSKAQPGSDTLWHVFRVESGVPLMGVDMNENTIPQEANLDTLGGISFSKGCYTGQETVARVHFRGHVNKHLRGLKSAEPLSLLASVSDGAGKVIGTVTSVVVSPAHGPIALAMIRREVAAGAMVSSEGASGPQSAEVFMLPF